MGGIRCRACRRYVLRWPHIVIIVALCVFMLAALLELLYRFEVGVWRPDPTQHVR